MYVLYIHMYFRQLGTGYGRAWGLRLSVIGCLYVCICTEYVCEGYVCMYVINHTCTYVHHMYVHVHTYVDQDEFSPLLSFDRKLSYVMIIINNFDLTLILEYLLHL